MILLICGAGQFGLVAKEVADAMGCFSEILFLDDNSELAVGKISEIENVKYDVGFVAIGNPDIRKLLSHKLKSMATLIHPKAIIMSSAKIGSGSIIEAGAVVCSNAEIGNGNIIMSNAVVGHDAKVGDFCQLKYNCAVHERAVVQNCTKVECNAVYGN